MRNDFKAAADQFNMFFRYARRDYQNLIMDTEPDGTYLFVDPVKTTPIRSGTGVTTGNTVTGKFMLLVKSSMDEMYDESGNDDGVNEDAKYQAHIEPLKATLQSFLDWMEKCGEGWEIQYSYTEVINVFDEGMDGLLVTYTAKSF